MSVTTLHGCDPRPVWIGQVAVSACAECGQIEWLSREGRLDHAEAVAALFGAYELIGPLDALGSPTDRVLAYSPPSHKKRRNLDALPKNVWLKAGPSLWMSHDGDTLLLATTEPVLLENLTRGA